MLAQQKQISLCVICNIVQDESTALMVACSTEKRSTKIVKLLLAQPNIDLNTISQVTTLRLLVLLKVRLTVLISL